MTVLTLSTLKLMLHEAKFLINPITRVNENREVRIEENILNSTNIVSDIKTCTYVHLKCFIYLCIYIYIFLLLLKI